jgi:hypothetical protein
MRGLSLASTVLAMFAGACGTGDDVASGGRGLCAAGGALTDCPDAAHTAEAACWRLVDCGAIPLDHPEEYRFDWGRCVDGLETMRDEYRQLVVSCIAASTCDQLRVDGSPDRPNLSQLYCWQLGDPR